LGRGGSKFGRPSASSLKSVKDARKYFAGVQKAIEKKMDYDIYLEAAKAEIQAKEETPYLTGELEKSVEIIVSADKRRKGLIGTAYARNPETVLVSPSY